MAVTPGLEFQKIRLEHRAGLIDLFSAICQAGEDRFFHPHPFTDSYIDTLMQYKGADWYSVAVSSERVLAYGMLRGWEEGYTVPSLGIAVHPDARGSGLARAFMIYLHAVAKHRGAPSIRLKVYPQNTSARWLYSNLGYQFQPTSGEQLLGTLELGSRKHVA